MSVTKTLFMRAECLPSFSNFKAFERKYVIDVLKENSYPKDFRQNCLESVHPSRKTTENDSFMMGFAVVSPLQIPSAATQANKYMKNTNIYRKAKIYRVQHI